MLEARRPKSESWEKRSRQRGAKGFIRALLHPCFRRRPIRTKGRDRQSRRRGSLQATVHISGHVDLRPRSSVFFSCLLDAKHGSIVLRDNSDIQDNTHIHCSEDGVFIGRETTIGHNVHMLDCRIGDRSLVGIGSVIQSGTIIDDDVLLAAGSRTQPGQHLEGDWLWAGRPARPISKLNHTKRTMMRAIIEQYCAYGDAYRELQTRITR
jgi:carbonic anhydrase/acetyltransferase-like protein (isoleucine patch superfamily)